MVKDEVLGSSGDEDQIALTLRQMALVDQVIGLEAEVARLHAAERGEGGAREEVERLRGELRAVYGSRTWSLGKALMLPARAAARLMDRR